MSRATTAAVPPPATPVRIIKGIVLFGACLLVLVPFLGIVSTSLASREAVTGAGGFLLIPDGVHWDAYTAVLSGGVVTRALMVSIGVTLVGTAVSLAFTSMLAYTLSARTGTFGQRPMLMLVLLALLFGPGMIPSYLVVRELGLTDNYLALILPGAVAAFNVIIVRSFFLGLPAELLDSARIDGASEFTIFRKIVLPLSKAALAVIGLFYAVGYWNSFFNALLYINDNAMWPLQLVLRSYVVDGASLGSGELSSMGDVFPPQQSIQMAILVISIVPILIVYPFLQKHFAKGVLTGAVKG
ncbi:carbohydrate ABC transporter permease [Occultella kanbiaonis]|uniref:carbohydrate ABC transporter permease n=1 Tax=Occultella kanbiaonis TaxID=2675754 RepID=UPI0013D0B3FC|nr:carbohydrate ABC transporter permease [Occultella kanbiaonis]